MDGHRLVTPEVRDRDPLRPLNSIRSSYFWTANLVFYFSLLIWGRSSIWLERQIVDLKVEGSSPFDPANYTPVARRVYETRNCNWSWKCRFETCLVYYGLRLLWPSKNTGSYSSSQRIQINEFLEFVGSFCSKSKTFIYAVGVLLASRVRHRADKKPAFMRL